MDSTQYRELAKRTMNNQLERGQKLTMLAMGIGGEASEITDLIKKVIFHGHELDREEIVKEAGDCLWYIENLLDLLDIPMSEVYEKNIEKLKRRYPNGFDKEDSKNRIE